MAQSSLMANMDRYIAYFADTYYNDYRKRYYGIKTCRPQGKMWLDTIRYQLIEYEMLDAQDQICQLTCNPLNPSSVSISYYDSCCSKSCAIVNVNKGTAYVYTQPTPVTVWTITHNLGYVPNVFTEDNNNTDIVGVVSVVNDNKITITFNTPVAGVAYLS